VTGVNGANATTTYDSFEHPSQATIPDGAQTNYSYTYNPSVQTATLGSRWKKTTLDGFWRVIRVETGHDGGHSRSVWKIDLHRSASRRQGRALPVIMLLSL
jgi:hypothetical protein